MSDQSPEPSNFDQWERASNQELKLLTTLADVEKKHAETLHQYAQTANLEEATRAARMANEQAAYIEHRVRVRDYEVRQKLKAIESHRAWLQVLKQGRTVSGKSIAAVWQAFWWYHGNTPAGKWQTVFAEHIAFDEEQVVQVLKKPLTIMPINGTVGAAIFWLAANFALPVAGTPLHLKIIELIGALESTEGERAALLEAWQDKIHTASQEELKIVRDLLQVSLKST